MVSAADILEAAILVVDDREANIALLKGMLRLAGYLHVESTTDPGEVCELYRRKHYDLILLDLQMPGMDGFRVMQDLQEIEGDGYLPVLVITAQPDLKLRALEAGAKDFVSKPFDFGELRARVRNILEVRLLHREARNHGRALEETVRDLEASREALRLKTLEEKRRREGELRLAQETQESLLPRSLPQFKNFRIHAFNSPTRYVGGDFYDLLPLPSGDWVGVLADVSGKGMPAALLSSMVLGALNMDFRCGAPAQEVLNRINRLLCAKSLPDQFVTLFLFLMGPCGAGRFISAGHNPAFLFRALSGKVERLAAEHFFLGMFDFATYQSGEFQLDPGDILIVYSDGLTDAENENEAVFGEAALLRVIREEAPSGSQALRQSILAALEAHTHGTPQTDDITFLLVERVE